MENCVKFQYETYILASPDIVWNALTDNEILKQYWFNHKNVSDWQIGSTWKHIDCDNENSVDMTGKVIEFTPPRRIVITWTLPKDLEDLEKASRVTLEVKPFYGITRLIVIHDKLEPGSEMLNGISHGWPIVFSSLKSLLETGHALPITTEQCMESENDL